MKIKEIILAILSGVLLLPLSANATGAGFVPSTGVWFSRDTFTSGENIRIYTVVMNNDYYLLNGKVSFYDNGVLIDQVEIKNLAKETAKEVQVFWKPSEGEHNVSTVFESPVAVDEKGNQQVLDSTKINQQAGAPLTVPGGTVEPVSAAVANWPVGSSSSSSTGAGVVKLTVVKSGNKLSLAPAVVGAVAVSSSTSLSDQIISGSGVGAAAMDAFAKNKEMLDKAGAMVQTVTTTAGKIGQAYDDVKSVAQKSQELYNQGQEKWNSIKQIFSLPRPIFSKVFTI